MVPLDTVRTMPSSLRIPQASATATIFLSALCLSWSGFGTSCIYALGGIHYDPGTSCWHRSFVSHQMAPPWKASLWPQSKAPHSLPSLLILPCYMLSYCPGGICDCPELSLPFICFLVDWLCPSSRTGATRNQGPCLVQCLLTTAGVQSSNERSFLPVQGGHSRERHLLASYLQEWWHFWALCLGCAKAPFIDDGAQLRSQFFFGDQGRVHSRPHHHGKDWSLRTNGHLLKALRLSNQVADWW